LIALEETAEAERPDGVDGAVVSAVVVTVTVALLAVEVPPVPVQVIVYVAFAVGDTDCVPLVALVPVHAPEAVHPVALVDDQVMVEALPEVMEAGDVEIVVVGIGETATR
jgi:hypothetical protein